MGEEGGYVEVRPKGVNKGVFAMKTIQNYDKNFAPGTNARVDFALVLGDDHCDTNVSADMECFTCTIGKKPSAAASYLQDVDEVEELLNALVKVSKNPNASKSMLDLMMMSAEAEATMNVTNPQGFGVAASNTLLTKAPPRGPPRVSATIGDYFDGMDDDEEEDMFF